MYTNGTQIQKSLSVLSYNYDCVYYMTLYAKSIEYIEAY